MTKFRKKSVIIDATQWFKNGDHPEDVHPLDCGWHQDWHSCNCGGLESSEEIEGKIVRYYRNPEKDGQDQCKYCNVIMHKHGWIDTLEGGHIVCPGDWVITGVEGEMYPCKPSVFDATYEPVE